MISNSILRSHLGLRRLATLTHFGNGVHLASSKELAKVDDPDNNITEHLTQYIGRNLHNQQDHPLSITKNKVFEYFNGFNQFSEFEPLVSTKQAFDDLLIPKDHVCRSKQDTFYYNKETILRSQATSYQSEIFAKGYDNYILCADVFRKDDVNRTHFPVFHQIDAGKLFSPDVGIEEVEKDLQQSLNGLCKFLFGAATKVRWSKDSFPFTDPSYEVEVFHNDSWIEILGSGVIKQDILKNAQRDNIGWAFGIGVERLAMIMYDIPDVRLFWSKDSRFSEQFREGVNKKFQPFSNFPPAPRDYSFFVPEKFVENDFFGLVRSVGGDLVETVTLIDEFKKGDQLSRCYRVVYRPLDKTFTKEEVNQIDTELQTVLTDYGCTLR